MRGQIKLKNSLFVFVVLGPGHPGAGRIKHIPLERNINSNIIEWDGDVVRISKQEERARTGSEFLHVMCDEIGKPELFDVYAEWVVAGSEGRTLDVPEFPAEMLPPKVLEWRKQRQKSTAQFDPRARLQSMGVAAPDSDLPTSEPSAAPLPGLPEVLAARTPRSTRSEPRIPTTIPIPTSAGDE